MPLNASAIYPAADPEFIAFPSRRSVVHSTNGMVGMYAATGRSGWTKNT